MLLAASSNTRGVIAGGYIQPSGPVSNIIDFVTIASTGDATDFGDLFEQELTILVVHQVKRGALFVGAYAIITI